MEQGFIFSQKQQLIFSQKQIQSLKLLAMDNYELSTFLQEEYNENPLLDVKSSDSAVSRPFSKASVTSDEAFQPEIRALDNNYLVDFIMSQIHYSEFNTLELKIMKLMILLMDDKGFFPYTPEDLMELYHIPAESSAKCLGILQTLEPSGIFQPDIAHYLLYQLHINGIENQSYTRLILNHLDDIASGNLRTIADDLAISVPEVRQMIRLVKLLPPPPLTGIGDSTNEYIIPDIIVEKSENNWNISLNDNWIENYSLNDYYIHMMQISTDVLLKDYFEKKYKRVHFIFQQIEQRRNTILAISNSVVQRQEAFFNGTAPLHPMTMSDVADELNLSVSTISRGIKNKYIQYPNGIVPLKSLFSTGLSQTGNEEISCSQVTLLLHQLIQHENKAKPFSDQALTNALIQKGIHISRRTVTKYRTLANIPNASERKATLI